MRALCARYTGPQVIRNLLKTLSVPLWGVKFGILKCLSILNGKGKGKRSHKRRSSAHHVGVWEPEGSFAMCGSAQLHRVKSVQFVPCFFNFRAILHSAGFKEGGFSYSAPLPGVVEQLEGRLSAGMWGICCKEKRARMPPGIQELPALCAGWKLVL